MYTLYYMYMTQIILRGRWKINIKQKRIWIKKMERYVQIYFKNKQ